MAAAVKDEAEENAAHFAGLAGSEVVGAGCPVQQGAELCPTPAPTPCPETWSHAAQDTSTGFPIKPSFT